MAGSHLLITGEPHCDQDRLARVVHAVSLFRGRPPVALDHVSATPDTPDPEDAQRDLALHRAAAARLFSPMYQTRVIALARTIAVASVVLGERYVKQMMHVRLEPLWRRRGAIHRLLDGMFEERASSLRVSAMTLQNQDALRRHRWARNFASLREAADRLVVVAREPSLRRAALALGVPPATFHNWFANIVGLELPLLAAVTAVASQGAVS